MAVGGRLFQLGVRVDRSDDPFPAGPPVALQVEITSDCQLRCRMCPLTTGTSSTSAARLAMAPALVEEVLEAGIRCGAVLLAGYGEALLHPDCLDLLRRLDDAGVRIGMSTNGIGVTPAIAAALAELRHLTLVNVSIDSPDPAVYRAVRVGSLRQALAGLRNLVAALDDPTKVRVSAVAMKHTLPTLAAFPPLLAELGVRRFELQSVIDYTDYAEAHRLLGTADLREHLTAIETSCRELGIDLQLAAGDRMLADLDDPDLTRVSFLGGGLEDWDETMTRQCHVPWEIPYIDRAGSVFPCCFAGSQNESQLGSLDTERFEDVWTGPAFAEFRAALTDGRTTPDICRRCTVAPLGPHLFGVWAASIEAVEVTGQRWRAATVEVRVRNDGAVSWGPQQHVRLGTSAPRNCRSLLEDGSWGDPNRPAEVAEEVAPGQTTTLRFVVRSRGFRGHETTFELLVEGQCWIPNTAFTVSATTPGWLRRAAVLVRR